MGKIRMFEGLIIGQRVRVTPLKYRRPPRATTGTIMSFIPKHAYVAVKIDGNKGITLYERYRVSAIARPPMDDRISYTQKMLALLTPRSMNIREIVKATGLRRKQVLGILYSKSVRSKLEKIKRIGHDGKREVRYTTLPSHLISKPSLPPRTVLAKRNAELQAENARLRKELVALHGKVLFATPPAAAGGGDGET